MRKRLATAWMIMTLAVSAAAALYYAYFMWEQDWGPMMTRGHNLMLVLMLFGTVFVFLSVLMVLGMIATWIDPKMGS